MLFTKSIIEFLLFKEYLCSFNAYFLNTSSASIITKLFDLCILFSLFDSYDVLLLSLLFFSSNLKCSNDLVLFSASEVGRFTEVFKSVLEMDNIFSSSEILTDELICLSSLFNILLEDSIVLANFSNMFF